MKIAIIHSVAGISSKILATAFKNNGIEAQVFRTSTMDKKDFYDFDHVFSYGTGYKTLHNNRLNSSAAVRNCISKPLSFECFKRAQVNTVDYVLKKPIPAHWDWVVIRDDAEGRKAEGLSYHENNEHVPLGNLYTEYFEHKYEYRIMVFRNQVVGRYFKQEDNGDWYFNLQRPQGFDIIDDHCIRAAKALQIDYVGFDVVANTKKDFRILEANSAARITDEAENAIVEYFLNLE